MVIILFALDWKYPFWTNLIQKIKLVSLSLNLVPRLIRICRNSMTSFTFSALDCKNFFWANLVQTIKIVCLSWNLVTRLIRICRIQWWCLLFLFQTGNTFLDKFGPKNQNCLFKLSINLIVHNLLINYYKRVNTEAVAHRCSVAILKNQKQPLADVLWNRFS